MCEWCNKEGYDVIVHSEGKMMGVCADCYLKNLYSSGVKNDKDTET
jgi:ribosome-binding protein aMBF1 (putative translation factor)